LATVLSLGLLLSLALSSCTRGDGSDIGPDLRLLPPGDYKVLVRNDQGEAVVEAQILIAGVTGTATTGHTGRAMVTAVFDGTRVITVDGTNASATDNPDTQEDDDELGTLSISTDTTGQQELPFTVFLPDVSGSTGLTMTTGAQGTPQTLADSGTSSGAELIVSAGDTVTFGMASSVTVKSGPLADVHLPGAIPGFLPGQAFTGRGVFISPVGVQFNIGASLSLPNDLALGASATADLYHLNPTTGIWSRVGGGTETGGRILAPTGSVQSGGLYTFVATSASSTVVTGRVLDKAVPPALPVPVEGVLVRGPQATTRTDGLGQYTLPPMARLDGSGSDRAVTVEFDGGRDFLPVRATAPVTLDAATKTVDLPLDTVRVRDVRVLMINRGVRHPLQPINMSGEAGLNDGIANGNEIAQAWHNDLPTGWVGFETSRPKDADLIIRTVGVFELEGDPSALDIRVFGDEVGWLPRRGNSTLTRVLDKVGTGPIELAYVIVGLLAGTGLEDLTNEFGITGADIGKDGQVTGVFSSESDGRKVVSAITMVMVNTGEISLPVGRALRRNLGAFQRFGMFAGSLTNGVGSNTRRVRSSGTMTLQDFYNQTFLSQQPTFRIPKKVDPAVTGGTNYLFGVPNGLGHLAATEGTTTTGVFTLERLGLALNLPAVEGTRTTQDLELSLVANTPFTVTNALVDKDASIANSDLRFDLAGELPKNTLVDIDQNIGGNMTVSGNNLIFTLPAVPPALKSYVLGLHGSALSSGRTITQQTFIRLDGVTAPTVPMLPPPTVTSPTPGGTISSSGFTVTLAAPANTMYTVLQLRTNDDPDDVREWTVLLPASTTSFPFVTWQTGVPTLLVPGRTWTFTATSVRIDSGPLVDPMYDEVAAYLRINANWVGIKEADREVAAFASNSFTVTSN